MLTPGAAIPSANRGADRFPTLPQGHTLPGADPEGIPQDQDILRFHAVCIMIAHPGAARPAESRKDKKDFRV
jgi:hypothetical protein